MRIIFILLVLVISNSVRAQDYLGEWVVDKISASDISNLSTKEAREFIDFSLSYQSQKASSGTKTCSKISYREELFNESKLHSYHRVFFADLGIEGVDKVSNIEVFCNNSPWYEFGAFIIRAGSKIFVSYSGYVYQLRSKNT